MYEIVSIFLNYKLVILFYASVLLVLFLNRKKFDFQGKLIALYRTKVGLRLMERVSQKYREAVKLFGFCSIGVAYVGLMFVTVLLMKATFDLITNAPGARGATPVIPGVPIAGTGLVFPLITGWVALFIIMIVHEFSHGVVARAFNIKIISSGIAFFGPILGAFVEPDEKQLEKRPDVEQYSVFSAGPVSNLILALVVFLLIGYVLAPVSNAITIPIGVKIGIQEGLPAEDAGIPAGSVVTSIDNKTVYDVESFMNVSKDIKPNQTVVIGTSNGSYSLLTTSNPEDSSKGYYGVKLMKNERELKFKSGFFGVSNSILKWLLELGFWVYFLSLIIGLINLFPIFITDGARIFRTTMLKFIPDKRKALLMWVRLNMIAVLILLLLVFIPFFRWLSGFMV